MKVFKRLVVLLTAMLMLFCMPLTVSAAGGGDAAEPQASGLISNSHATLTAGQLRVLLNASVSANEIMAEIGFKNIKIQQSTRESGSWSDYFNPSNQLNYNAKSHALEDFLIAVPGGYYYRVQLTFYAKETGWFFPSSQSSTTTTNVVYVPVS